MFLLLQRRGGSPASSMGALVVSGWAMVFWRHFGASAGPGLALLTWLAGVALGLSMVRDQGGSPASMAAVVAVWLFGPVAGDWPATLRALGCLAVGALAALGTLVAAALYTEGRAPRSRADLARAALDVCGFARAARDQAAWSLAAARLALEPPDVLRAADEPIPLRGAPIRLGDAVVAAFRVVACDAGAGAPRAALRARRQRLAAAWLYRRGGLEAEDWDRCIARLLGGREAGPARHVLDLHRAGGAALGVAVAVEIHAGGMESARRRLALCRGGSAEEVAVVSDRPTIGGFTAEDFVRAALAAEAPAG